MDYFAYMFRFYHVHSSEVVPAGTSAESPFEELWGKPLKLAVHAADAADTISRNDAPSIFFPGDVLALREALLKKGILQRSRVAPESP